MNRLTARIRKLERDRRSGLARWWGLPFSDWPDDAIVAFLAETEDWPPDHQPTDAELDALLAQGGGP